MTRDQERVQRICGAIRDANWDGLLCSLPSNVLLLSGYWPVVGGSMGLVTKEGRVGLLVPEDELELARKGWADEICTFQGGSLDELKTTGKAVRAPLSQLAKKLELGGIIGFEQGEFHEPSSYASMFFYGGALGEIVEEAMPGTRLVSADAQLMTLRSIATPGELARLRKACRIAGHAYEHGAKELMIGLTEAEAAVCFRELLSTKGIGFEGVERADGFTFCMSGPNSAEAHAAYQRSRSRVMEHGDLALVHCNSYADGFWTDITRTFCLGEPDERKLRLYEAIFAASQAAIKVVAPGVKNSDVDQAARMVLEKYGLGRLFKHGSGHGVGFTAINHAAHPRIHPASEARLETGMVFNIEPGIYMEGWGGLRHCDMVAVTEKGAELLTPFQCSLEELIVK
jgi:Xaa-Pro dipeptidase